MLKEKGYSVTQMEPREAGIDSLLRRSMAAPVPSLQRDFDQRLMREVRRSSQCATDTTGFCSLATVSIMTSALVTRGRILGNSEVVYLINAAGSMG
jgi:hypothetical protein